MEEDARGRPGDHCRQRSGEQCAAVAGGDRTHPQDHHGDHSTDHDQPTEQADDTGLGGKLCVQVVRGVGGVHHRCFHSPRVFGHPRVVGAGSEAVHGAIIEHRPRDLLGCFSSQDRRVDPVVDVGGEHVVDQRRQPVSHTRDHQHEREERYGDQAPSPDGRAARHDPDQHADGRSKEGASRLRQVHTDQESDCRTTPQCRRDAIVAADRPGQQRARKGHAHHEVSAPEVRVGKWPAVPQRCGELTGGFGDCGEAAEGHGSAEHNLIDQGEQRQDGERENDGRGHHPGPFAQLRQHQDDQQEYAVEEDAPEGPHRLLVVDAAQDRNGLRPKVDAHQAGEIGSPAVDLRPALGRTQRDTDGQCAKCKRRRKHRQLSVQCHDPRKVEDLGHDEDQQCHERPSHRIHGDGNRERRRGNQ